MGAAPAEHSIRADAVAAWIPCHGCRPTPPETPKLLPTVALVWLPLLGALHDARTPLVERAAGLLADVTRVGGGTFMARR